MTITHPRRADGIMSQVIRHTESAFRVEQQDENRFAITTPFIYPYDDPIILYLSYAADGRCIISDRGDANHWLNEVNGFESDGAHPGRLRVLGLELRNVRNQAHC